MWQLAYLWSLVPDWLITILVNGLIIAGLVGISASWIARWVPYFNLYRGPIQAIGVVCLVLGVYFKGGYSVEMAWRDRVAKLEEQVRISEAKSKQANQDLDRAIKEKKKTAKEVQVVIQERIREVEKKIDAECKVDPSAIEILNDSAKNSKGRNR